MVIGGFGPSDSASLLTCLIHSVADWAPPGLSEAPRGGGLVWPGDPSAGMIKRFFTLTMVWGGIAEIIEKEEAVERE